MAERQRGGVRRSWRLPRDAILDGIHAKVTNGELVVIVPKRKVRIFHPFDKPLSSWRELGFKGVRSVSVSCLCTHFVPNVLAHALAEMHVLVFYRRYGSRVRICRSYDLQMRCQGIPCRVQQSCPAKSVTQLCSSFLLLPNTRA